MSVWINLGLDIVLIALVTAGLVQATRLIGHLSGLQQGRMEMERFVRDFNATVMRAENGIKGLRQAARDSGDDLEKMLEKAVLVRDELGFIVESADQLASRLSESASSYARPAAVKAAEPRPAAVAATPPPASAPIQSDKVTPIRKPVEVIPSASAASRAERELLQALEKLG